jgi:hypothetical protein
MQLIMIALMTFVYQHPYMCFACVLQYVNYIIIGSCEHGGEPSGSIKGGEFLD